MLKKYSLGLFALVLGVVLVTSQAFRSPKAEPAKANTSYKWYRFTGGSTHTGENSASNYTLLPGQNPAAEGCQGSEYVCLILAPEGPNSQPDLPNMTDVFSDSRIEQLIPKD
jgi:hypothetical protein